MAGWLHTEIDVRHRELNPDTVAHLSTNRTRRRLTLYFCTMSTVSEYIYIPASTLCGLKAPVASSAWVANVAFTLLHDVDDPLIDFTQRRDLHTHSNMNDNHSKNNQPYRDVKVSRLVSVSISVSHSKPPSNPRRHTVELYVYAFTAPCIHTHTADVALRQVQTGWYL